MATFTYAVAALLTLGFLIFEYNNPPDLLSDMMPSIANMLRDVAGEVAHSVIDNVTNASCGVADNVTQQVCNCTCPPLGQ